MNEIRLRAVDQVFHDERRMNRCLTTPSISLKSFVVVIVLTAIISMGVGAYLMNGVYIELIVRIGPK